MRRLEQLLETPLIILGFLWLVLLIIELVWELSPPLQTAATVIWIIFVADFFMKLILAPERGRYLRRNVLTIISLLVPALRVLRIVRVVRFATVARGARLVKVFGSLNRGIRALGETMKRRAVGYVAALSFLILFVGSAGMYAFERDEGLQTYSTALWWTAMLLTTMGSEYWPKTPEGRILCFFLALYAFAMFGYVTATISTFFIGRDEEDKRQEKTVSRRNCARCGKGSSRSTRTENLCSDTVVDVTR